ncbi:nuclease A inhibitor family protein [Pontibacter harenae]|uniref:nuclease A inhibitor family protein n=1 Tax=Pontibacter harenae TaxID=2894083 RepID=UPI001E2930CF|nr:nuclease A inhibitor family protein [Pontibacter harenae]MCC9165592.1 nuclease A inhibitor family protein [Pontibacter harenae]
MELQEIKNELSNLTDRLSLESATSEPFEFYHDEQHDASALNEETVRKLAGMPSHYPTEVLPVQELFQAYAGDKEENKQRFQKLQEKLQELLQDVKAYCVGEVRRTVFILGTTEKGEIAGLKSALTRPY